VLQGMTFFTFAWFSLAMFLLLLYAVVRLWVLLRRRNR